MPSRFLSKRLVLAMHRDLIDTFGGARGLRDEAALDSALAQPEATFRGRLLHRGVPEQAAAYLFHLCMAHAFVDGNKRVAFAAADTFVRLNGHRLTLTHDEAFGLVTALASGDVTKEQLTTALRPSVVPSTEREP